MKPQTFLRFIARAFAFLAVSVSWLPGAGVDYLSQQSGAVFVGSVSTRVETPTQVSFTVNVVRVLSGSVPSLAVNIVHQWAGSLRTASAVTIDQPLYGIWFLNGGSLGHPWDVLTARPSMGVRIILGLFLPASTTPPMIAAGTSSLDNILHEVAAGVQSAPAGSPDGDPTILLDAFGSTDTPAVRTMIAAGLASDNPGYQAVSLAGGLARGLPGMIHELSALWPQINGDRHAMYVVSALRDSWRDTTPAEVQDAASLAASAPPGSNGLRAAAVRALAAIHTPGTLPFLATLLSSADPSEQERAVYGLSSFANGCPVQSPRNAASMAYLECNQPSSYTTADTLANFGFRQGLPAQEAPLVAYWQTWWNGHSELH
jgi:hypothetical protein